MLRASCTSTIAMLRPLSCIITGGPDSILRSVNEVKPKTWRIFRQNDTISMTTGPQIHGDCHSTGFNYEPATVFTHPWFLQKIFQIFEVNQFLFCYFRHIFSMFDHLFKDVKDVHVILVRERQQRAIKTSQNVDKNEISSRANSSLLRGLLNMQSTINR